MPISKSWMYLIGIAVFSLFIVIGWQTYQISSGGTSQITDSVIEMKHDTLLAPTVENFLKTDPKFSATQLQNSSSGANGQ